jgi:hypothetical protein
VRGRRQAIGGQAIDGESGSVHTQPEPRRRSLWYQGRNGEAMMSQSPPPSLLRLQEKDVVRLCGLVAAGQGLDLAIHLQVTTCRRAGARLEATVEEAGQTCLTWVELPGDLLPDAMRWGCARDAAGGAPAGTFGCPHVAALLSAWIRQPEDFVAVDNEPESALEVNASAADAAEALTRPVLAAMASEQWRHGVASLADDLRRLSATELLDRARRVLGTQPETDELARLHLEHTLRDPVLLSALVSRLDPSAARLLAELELLDGVLTAGELEDIARRGGRPIGALQAELHALEQHALLFPAPGRFEGASGQARHALAGWRVPSEIRAGLALPLPAAVLPLPHLQGLPNLHAGANAGSKGARPQLRGADPHGLVLALALLARAPAPLGPLSHPLRDGESRQIRGATTNALTMVAGDISPERLAVLARRAGLPAGMTRMARRVLLWARERNAAHPLLDLAGVPPKERAPVLRGGFALWLDAESPAELADLDLAPGNIRVRYDPNHPAFRPAALAREVAEARTFCARLITLAQPGAWYALADLLDLVWRIRPFFLRGHQRTYATPCWWLETTGGRMLRPANHEEWLVGEGAYLAQMVRGPFHWWGALDLALDRAGEVKAFRLTSFGATLLRRADHVAEGEGTLEVETTPTLLPIREGSLAVEPLSAGSGLLDLLGTWARPVAIVRRRLLYTLSPDLAARAFDHGHTPEGLLALLRDLGGATGPRAAEAMAAPLGTRRASYGRARLAEGMALLEAKDEAVLAEALASAPELALRVHRLSPSAVLVPPSEVEALRAILKKRGFEI